MSQITITPLSFPNGALTLPLIAELSGVRDPRTLKVGQVIKVPSQ
jgi:nucleoid-associated protein YgaU